MIHKIKEIPCQAQGRKNISCSEIYCESNTKQPPKSFYKIFNDPHQAGPMLKYLFDQMDLIKDDGTLKYDVALASTHHAIEQYGGIFYPYVSRREFQRAVFEYFNTPFREQKKQNQNNSQKFYRYVAISARCLNDFLKSIGVVD